MLIKDIVSMFFIAFGLFILFGLAIEYFKYKKGIIDNDENSNTLAILVLTFTALYILIEFNYFDEISKIKGAASKFISLIVCLSAIFLAIESLGKIEFLIKTKFSRNILFYYNSIITKKEFKYLEHDGSISYKIGTYETRELFEYIIKNKYNSSELKDKYILIYNNLNIKIYEGIEQLLESVKNNKTHYYILKYGDYKFINIEEGLLEKSAEIFY